MKNIKAVVFDFDGLLANTDELIYQATKKYLADKFSIKIEVDEFSNIFGLSSDEFAKKIIEDYSLSVTSSDVLKGIISLINDNDIKLKPFALDLLQFLKGKYKLYLATNSSKPDLDQKTINMKETMDLFDKIITVEGVKPKPDPEIYLKTVKEAGFQPSECCVLEDSEIGVISALGAGCEAIFIPNKFIKEPNKIRDKRKITLCQSLKDVIPILNEAKND